MKYQVGSLMSLKSLSPFLSIYLFVWLHQVLVWHMQDFSLRHMDSVVAPYRLSCSETCGMLVYWPRIKPMSPALQGGFLTTGPPEKSLKSFDPEIICNNSSKELIHWLSYHKRNGEPKLFLYLKISIVHFSCCVFFLIKT